jgi:hypothetical protein
MQIRTPYTIALIALLAIVVVIKFNYLSLPFYWDEAWVYGPAVHALYNHGLSLFPDALTPELSRGHPLLFHFTAAMWMTVFGKSVFSLHVFALLIALLFMVAVFNFGKTVFSPETGIVTAAVGSIQSIFLAQSGMLLPEIFLSLWILLSIGLYLRKKYWLYALTAACALMTKETGITLIASVLVFDLIIRRKFDRQLAILFVPLLPWFIFLLFQKYYNGWYFFPEHIGYLNFSIAHIGDIMENYFSLIFIYYGRNLILFTTLFAIVFVLIRKQWRKFFINATSNHGLLLFGIFMLVFIVFGGINFYSDRNTIALLAPFILCCVYLIEKCIQRKAVYFTAIAAFVLTSAYYTFAYESTSDHNLGYAKYCRVQQQCVNYFVANKWQGKNICTTFLMQDYLGNPYSGYVSGENKMLHITNEVKPETDFIVVLSSEKYENLEENAVQQKWNLIKTFSEGKAEIKVFSKN